MIALETIQDMFDNIRNNTEWNIDGPMLWGYFFTDESLEKLESIVPSLEAQGYRYVGVFEADIEDGEMPYYFLHAEKEETHSVASLNERNQHLYALAELHNLASYDGMDVGPIEEQ